MPQGYEEIVVFNVYNDVYLPIPTTLKSVSVRSHVRSYIIITIYVFTYPDDAEV